LREHKVTNDVHWLENSNQGIIAFSKNGREEEDHFLQIRVSEFFMSFKADQAILYQEKNRSDLHIIPELGEPYVLQGEFSLYGAFNTENGPAVINVPEKKYFLVNLASGELNDLGFLYSPSFCNYPLLFQKKKSTIDIYNIDHDVRTTIDIKPFFRDLDDRIDEIIGLHQEEWLLIRLKSGLLLKWNIQSVETKVIRQLIGRCVLFNEQLYSVTNNILEKINLESGQIVQPKNLDGLAKKYNFHPTGRHKVYDDYIFIMSAGKPGMVTIFERSSFSFKDLISFSGQIPVGTEHLHWKNDKLYVLDGGNTLHIYEQ